MNFGDVVTEIPAQNASFAQKRERERKKKNCGNGVAKIVGERKKKIKTMELPKL